MTGMTGMTSLTGRSVGIGSQDVRRADLFVKGSPTINNPDDSFARRDQDHNFMKTSGGYRRS